jgi:hypothetical protein
MVTKHIWKNKRDPDGDSIFKCERCGLIVSDIGCGVPNVFGAIGVEIDCNDSIIQQIHEEEFITIYDL